MKYKHNKTGTVYTVLSKEHQHKENGQWVNSILYQDSEGNTFSRPFDTNEHIKQFNQSFTLVQE